MSQLWLFSAEQLETSTPSRDDGVSFEQEMKLRSLGSSLLREAGAALQLDIEVIGIAIVLFHRFYCAKSLEQHKNLFLVSAACIFLASKSSGEGPRKLGDIVTVFHYIQTQPKSEILEIGEDYWKAKSLLVEAEKEILCSLLFDLTVSLPYRYILAFCHSLQGDSRLSKLALKICSDTFCSTLCVQWEPEKIAIGCINVSAQLLKIRLPTQFTVPWHCAMGTSKASLEEITNMITQTVSAPCPDLMLYLCSGEHSFSLVSRE